MLRITSKSRRPIKIQLDSGKAVKLACHGDSLEISEADRKTESIRVLSKQKRIKAVNVVEEEKPPGESGDGSPAGDSVNDDNPAGDSGGSQGPAVAQRQIQNNRDRKKHRGGNNRG